VDDSLVEVLASAVAGPLQGRTWWIEFSGISPTQRYIQFRFVDGALPNPLFWALPV